MFSFDFMVVPETELFIRLKKSFSCSSVFISVHDFNQALWLNLMTLWFFSKTICDLMLALDLLSKQNIIFYHPS